MTNTYEVGDRVKVIIPKKVIYKGEEKTFDDTYAGTIITYRKLDHPTEGEKYFYKVSVDGIGDIVVATELEDGSLQLTNEFGGE